MTKAGLIFIACTSLISACGNGGSAAYRNSSSNSSNTSVGSYEDTSPGSSETEFCGGTVKTILYQVRRQATRAAAAAAVNEKVYRPDHFLARRRSIH